MLRGSKIAIAALALSVAWVKSRQAARTTDTSPCGEIS